MRACPLISPPLLAPEPAWLLQEALASELAARMNAMNSASDNAKELKKQLSLKFNRQRQAMITTQLIEIISGADAA